MSNLSFERRLGSSFGSRCSWRIGIAAIVLFGPACSARHSSERTGSQDQSSVNGVSACSGIAAANTALSRAQIDCPSATWNVGSHGQDCSWLGTTDCTGAYDDCVAIGTAPSTCASQKTACLALVPGVCAEAGAQAIAAFVDSLNDRQRTRCLTNALTTWEATYNNTVAGSTLCTLTTESVCSADTYTMAVTGKFDADGKPDAFYYDPGLGNARLALSSRSSPWTKGFNTYDFMNSADRVITIDYNGDGFDDLLFYRPGVGFNYLQRANGDGTFTLVSGQSGMAGYDLASPNDRVHAFDYDGDGKQDLIMYRPGTGKITIARSNGDKTFSPFYATNSIGIGGFDLLSTADRIVPIDFNGDGKMDLFIYRRGQGAVWILQSFGIGGFVTVSANASGGLLGARWDFSNMRDEVLPFDFNGDHKTDLVLYRPKYGLILIAQSNGDGTYSRAFRSTTGLAGLNLAHSGDRIVAFDYNGDHFDDLVLYRPATASGGGVSKILVVAKGNGDGTFTQVYSGTGVSPGFDLSSMYDTIYAPPTHGQVQPQLFFVRPTQGVGRVVTVNANGQPKAGPCAAECGNQCLL